MVNKSPSFWKIIILSVSLLIFYNANSLYVWASKTIEKPEKDDSARMQDDVKIGIVFTLSSLADSSDIPFLKELIAKTEPTDYINRDFCTGALVRLGEVSALDALLKDLDDDNNSFRLLTAEIIGKLNKGDVAAPRYIARLKDRDLSKIAVSLRILGKLSDDKTLPAIIEQTSNKNESIKKEAVLALGDFKDRTSASVLETLINLLKDGSETVRIQAASSLGGLYEKRILEDLLNRNPGSDEAKKTFSLSIENGRKAAVELKKLLKDSSNSVKNAAILSLGLLEDKASVSSIAEELHNNDALIRKVAACAIGKIKDSSVAPKLVTLFNDPDINVQIEAVKTAGLLGDSVLLDDVLKKLGSKNIDLEAAVLVAAFQLGDPSIIDRCVDGIGNNDAVTKIANTKALGYMISTENTIKALNTALKDRHPLVRVSAVRSLRLLRSSASLSNIINIVTDRDREASVEACEAIKSFEDHQAVTALRKMLE